MESIMQILNTNEMEKNTNKTSFKITTTATIVIVVTLVIINQKFSARFARGYPNSLVSTLIILTHTLPEILAIQITNNNKNNKKNNNTTSSICR